MEQIIKTILVESKNKKIPEVIPRKLEIQDYLNMKINKIIVLNGFRRVGKTYILYEILNKIGQEQSIHINFEDERIPQKTEFITGLLPASEEIFGKKVRYLFLDELHNMPNWGKWLRRIYDENQDIRIFISGSSSKMSENEIPTELRGRFLEVKVFPLSFTEFLRFKQVNLKELEYSRPKVLNILNEYVNYGGMPEIALEENKKIELAQSYYSTVIKRDIIERYKIRNEEVLKALLKLLLDSKEYSINKLYNNLKSAGYVIGKGTLQKYVSYIESSYFTFSLSIFSYKIKDQMQYPKKVYFIDNVFIKSISTRFLNNNGRLYENLVAIELKRRGKNIFYYKNKEEVNFVVKENDQVQELIQVCYDISDSETKKREIRSLLKAGKELNCNKLMVITNSYNSEENAEWFDMHGKIRFISLLDWLLETTN